LFSCFCVLYVVNYWQKYGKKPGWGMVIRLKGGMSTGVGFFRRKRVFSVCFSSNVVSELVLIFFSMVFCGLSYV
jgi:hypothetical protein